MQTNLSKFMLLGLMLMISGCATNQHFDCKQNNGIKCKSLSEIDRRVTSGEIGEKPHLKSKNMNSLYLSNASGSQIQSNLRTKEEVGQIWIAAYETKEGIYHQPNTIHTVLKPSKWVKSASEIEQE